MTISSSIQKEFGKAVVIDFHDPIGPVPTPAQALKFKSVFNELKEFSKQKNMPVIVPMQTVHDEVILDVDAASEQGVEKAKYVFCTLGTGMGKANLSMHKDAHFGMVYGSSFSPLGVQPMRDTREEIENRARKAVQQFLNGSKEGEKTPRNGGKVSHYNAPVFSRPKHTPAVTSNVTLCDLLTKFTQKELDRQIEAHEKEVADIYTTHEVHLEQHRAYSSGLRIEIAKMKQQLKDMTRQRDEALEELTRIKDRNASIVRIMQAEGRRFRH